MTSAVTFRRSAERPDELATAVLRTFGRLGVAALLFFHACLLGVSLLDGRAFEPATAVRWGLAVLVLAAFRALRRRGSPLFFGRRAVGLWLLVVIIHCSAAWEGGAAAALDAAIPESITALAQLSVTVLVLGAAIAVASATARRHARRDRAGFPGPALIAGLPAAGFDFRFSPRPPPLA